MKNDNTEQRPLGTNKSDFIVPNKSKNDDIENERNTGDYVKPTKAAESNKTGKRNNADTRKNSTNPLIHSRKTIEQHVKKYDNVTVILGDSLVKDLTRT